MELKVKDIDNSVLYKWIRENHTYDCRYADIVIYNIDIIDNYHSGDFTRLIRFNASPIRELVPFIIPVHEYIGFIRNLRINKILS